MLTLKEPIQLHIASGLTGNAEAFGARILGNYRLLGAHYTPKDLLFLLAAPPEPGEDQGGMTTLVNQQTNLDVRTVTMGISLLDCCDSSAEAACRKIYDKITRSAKDLVRVGEEIEAEFGIPIVNKRISVTPIALVAAASEAADYVLAKALDRAREATGVDFIGGFSAWCRRG